MYYAKKTEFLEPCSRNYYDGIVVSVSKGDPIIFAIINSIYCCESFGVDIQFPDGLTRDDFIGAAIENVRWGEEKRTDDYCFSEIIVETRIGNFIITAFNYHDGYYSHDVIACFNDTVEHFSL